MELMHEEEYYTIAELEEKHWWYKSLHALVIDAIKRNFAGTDISIVDAGCGTGGLMQLLSKEGYNNLKGFDLSDTAVFLSRKKGLNVLKGDIRNIGDYYPANSADVVISNDTFYFLDEAEQKQAADMIYNLLRKDGVLILNLPALNAFRGVHDLRVGIKANRRFNKKKVYEMLNFNKFTLLKVSYWPFLLSPFIWVVRCKQRISLRLNKSTPVVSDVKMGNKWVNKLLLYLTGFETHYVKSKAFGSSLFVVAQVRK